VNVLYVIDDLSEGGVERSTAELLSVLPRRGVRPSVVCLRAAPGSLEDAVRRLGIEVDCIAAPGPRAAVSGIRRRLRAFSPDLIHSALFKANLLARLAAAGSGIPLLNSLTGMPYHDSRLADPQVRRTRLRLARLLDRHTGHLFATHFHAVSEAVREAALRDLRIAPERLTVVERGRDPVRLGRRSDERRRRVRRALGIDEEQPVLISVGRQDFPKAHDRLLAGLALLRDRIPSVRLLLAGRRSHASDRLDALSRELHLDRHVDRLGHRPDVPDLLAAADVFVLSSRFEGLPGCVIEALALELPVISAAIPSVAGLVVDEHNGLLVDSGTGFAGEMADAAARLFGDSGLRRLMGERGREIFESRFTLEDSGRRMFELYETLCGTSRGA